MNEKKTDRSVFEAVSDSNRRKLLHILADAEELPLHDLTVQFDIGRTAVSKHLKILKEADLVVSRKVGRETRYRLNASPLKEIKDWLSFYEDFWKERISKLSQLLEEQKMTADVTLDFQLDSSIEVVWSALTNSDMLAQWIWDNDFKPVTGHKFQFRSEPNEYWDGIVNGEVIQVDEPRKLSYVWASAGETTTITWTLKSVDEGTALHFEQTGFSEETKATEGAIEGAKYSWMEFGKKLKSIVETQ
ncbi:metalloregulator ArsR/SmtB family transcription factor [Desemzia sp. RIT804]|uniref:metalloregulator ArsR/SmtB family transcription factor n=1 Tax=Desemzia sp. RIT 804 TaxID=2810209 RepID=UPI0019504D28|nr:metalloregulator ArsR/SmtB family transcription factor [Desemzia sp. RIT 804]MBM6614847.1 metalloregulator ArsR/SmtB family transcription factor [Desemzia sp. RIT 804]